MHPALQISEFVDMIVKNLQGSSLTAFARVCRAFHVVASAHIWSDLNNDSIKRIQEIAFGEPFLDFGPPEIPPIGRKQGFLIHDSAITRIQIKIDDYNHVFLQQFVTLLCMRPEPRLPNLRSLIYHLGSSDREGDLHFFYLFSLLSRSLQNLSIVFDGQPIQQQVDAFLRCLLEKVRRECPGLTSITFAGEGMPPVSALYRDPMHDLLAQLDHLVSYKGNLIALDPVILPKLASLPELRELGIQQSSWERIPSDIRPSLHAVRNGFRALRILDLETYRFSIPASILRAIGSRVESLKLRVSFGDRDEGFDIADLRALCDCVASSSPALKKVHFRLEQLHNYLSGVLSWDSLHPLLHCSRLTSFHLDFGIFLPFDFKDCDITAIAMAFPSLLSLSITWNRRRNPWRVRGGNGLLDEDKLTLAGLASLARYCTQLEDLTITSFNGIVIPRPPLLPLSKRVSLMITSAVLNEPCLVASFILCFWPDVEIVPPSASPSSSAPPPAVSGSSDWQDVVEAIEEAQRVVCETMNPRLARETIRSFAEATFESRSSLALM